MAKERPNLVYVLCDQLRACSLGVYGDNQLSTPNVDRLASEGVTFTNLVSTSPVCTPYRGMLMTGRHPQTTGVLFNFVRTRHDEIGIGDAFSAAGYRTGYVGKWHLHTGAFPTTDDAADYVPEGRARLGFQHWRGYNLHTTYFNGTVNLDNWEFERWEGYETDALLRYSIEFMDDVGEDPFFLFLSPHQPHWTPYDFAPEEYYDRLPRQISLPANVPDSIREQSLEMYRHYLAMTLALDDMLGELLEYLDRTGRADNTLVVFTSDHGSQVGAHGINPWHKHRPYEESIRVPWIMRWPGILEEGIRRDSLTAPADIFPSLCSLCGIPVPRTVEGYDLSESWLGKPGAFEQDAVLMMNFSAHPDYLQNGLEWRGVRTKRYSYVRWLDGRVEMFDLEEDPLQMVNLVDDPDRADVRDQLERKLEELMARRGDQLVPCETYADWFDEQRRVVRNAVGSLRHPESQPDWTLLS